MSQCTTATTTHIITKYSRAYPSNNSETEWQHFTNPVMRLVLDITKSSGKTLEAVRLRIIWSMNQGNDSMDVDQREIVFEDLDLLSFSNLPSALDPASPGLPLKAVYRDLMVGIRYLHPRIPFTGSPPVYRRFQVNFSSSAASSQFIDSIRNVCPCKQNSPVSIPGVLAPSQSFMHSSKVQHSDSQSFSPGLPSATFQKRAREYATDSVSQSSSLRTQITIAPQVTSSERTAMSGNRDSDASSDLSTLSLSGLSQSDLYATKSIALPSSSPPSSLSSYSVTMPPPPVPASANAPISDATPLTNAVVPHIVPNPSTNTDNLQSQIIASLKRDTSLYSLSRAELEAVVTEIVREEGFDKLLRDLDSLWRVKGMLNK